MKNLEILHCLFQRQSWDFAAAVKAANKPVQLLFAEDSNHFEIIETLANPYGLLGSAVLPPNEASLGATAIDASEGEGKTEGPFCEERVFHVAQDEC